MDKKRRKFFTFLFSVMALIGVVASFGQWMRIVVAFLYPHKKKGRWYFVATTKSFTRGGSMEYKTPEGQSIAISRIGLTGTAKDFIALSNVCPHLGCKVYWEGTSSSFFCPCHNGRFSSVGKPLEGPPAQASQELIRFPLKIAKGLLYIQISSESLIRLSSLESRHDRCAHHKGFPA